MINVIIWVKKQGTTKLLKEIAEIDLEQHY